MKDVSKIGLNIAKYVFQLHGIDAGGAFVIRRRLRRDNVATFFASLPLSLIGIEASATGHHWARVLMYPVRHRNNRRNTPATGDPRVGPRATNPRTPH